MPIPIHQSGELFGDGVAFARGEMVAELEKSFFKGREVTKFGSGFLKIAGICTTDEQDFKGEVVDQQGLDWSYLLDRGWFTDNHRDGSADIIGFPTVIRPTKLKNGQLATYIEGYLFDDKVGRAIWEKMKLAQKAKRPYGFSIEGILPIREAGRIVKAKIVNVAVTPTPVNMGTVAWVLQSVTAKGLAIGEQPPDLPEGTGGGAALSGQSLDRRLAIETPDGGKVMPDPNKAKENLEQFYDTLSPAEKSALAEIQKEKGGVVDEAPAPEATPSEEPTPEATPPEEPTPEATPPEDNPPVEEPTPEATPEDEANKGADAEPVDEGDGSEEEEVAFSVKDGEGTTPTGDPPNGGEATTVDVTEFLENFTKNITGRLEKLFTKLDEMMNYNKEQQGKLTSAMKSLKDELAATPEGVFKGVGGGTGQGAPPQRPEDVRMDIASVQTTLKGVLHDPQTDYNRRMAVGDLLVRMDGGYYPSPDDLANVGCKTPQA